MIKIGITGNIGSGKTTVSKVFALLGVPVFYADTAAKEVMVKDAELMEGLVKLFGKESYLEDGVLNRKYIASKVFNNPDELAKLNALVHPAVFRAFDNWAVAYADVPYTLKEAALMFESDSYKMCDYTIVVTAPLEMRLQRVVGRDHITREEALARDARQMNEEEKIRLADYRIWNDDSRLVIPQVLELHQQFLKLAAGK
ncbi:dephospho-CoA kinase [Mucilaginibacter sp. RS28]|uniref:Dephospho-CoA kinase n=1 Tax=Mucilaginibacter straminoryzae TaxID=2932774 RepID=A0A9X2BD75_9SPHI|nr:dephospho-CoA kinase [Mucilaginibacter straminoryzae]MCJ8209988.1 dephospho-CoA kinase [Mucilaginibacter straminoryzae]